MSLDVSTRHYSTLPADSQLNHFKRAPLNDARHQRVRAAEGSAK